ncbi:MAG: tetratricopeptide repeat protein [Armatimonadetes bacterium]|nr:tetratricopeptide repeat protein [Armatimonadota bacterium]
MDLSTKEGRREQGARIQRAAESAGLSLEELAKEIGCSRALIYQYVAGSTLAQPHRLQQIAARTGKALGYFYAEGEGAEDRIERTQTELAEARRQVQAELERIQSERADVERRRLRDSFQHLCDLAQAQEGPVDLKGLISTCERIISLGRELDELRAVAGAHFRIGNARIRLAEHEAARASLERAIDLFHQVGQREDELAARQSLANVLLQLGNPHAAMEQFQMVAAAEDWWNRWKGTLSIGCVHEHLGEYRRALDQFDAALQIIDSSTDEHSITLGRLYVRSNIANVYIDCGDYAPALEISQSCLDDAEKLGLREQHIEAQINIGVCLLALGRLGECRQRLHRALEIARFVGDAARAAVARAWLCALEAACGQFDRAKELGKDALQTGLQTGSRRAGLYAHQHLGDAYQRSGMHREALYHYHQAQSIARDQRTVYYEALLMERCGGVERRLGSAERAAHLCGSAVEMADRIGAREVEGAAHVGLAHAALALGRLAEAEQSGRRALEIADAIEVPELRWRALGALARAAFERRQLDAAREHGAAAVAVIEGLRGQLRRNDEEDAILEDQDRELLYLEHARILEALGRSDDARAFLERAEWPPLLRRFGEDQG